jgi:putative phage-type endonuclease
MGGAAREQHWGSEIGAIMGFNKYKTPLQIYNEKVGLTPYADISDREPVYWGTILEPIVASEFEKRTGKKVAVLDKILHHQKYPYMTANIDRDIPNEDAGLECKTASAYAKAEWEEDEIPASYLLQCQWYLFITGARLWYIACLVGGQNFLWKAVPRDDELIGMMERDAVDFWENHVLKRVPPTATSGDVRDFNVKCKDAVDLPESANDILLDLLAVKEQMKQGDARKKELEARTKQLLDGHSKGKTGMFSVSWTQSEFEQFDASLFKDSNPSMANQYMKLVKRDNGISVKKVG